MFEAVHRLFGRQLIGAGPHLGADDEAPCAVNHIERVETANLRLGEEVFPETDRRSFEAEARLLAAPHVIGDLFQHQFQFGAFELDQAVCKVARRVLIILDACAENIVEA